MQVIYHGHSFIEIETEQGSILIDPFVTGNPQCDLSLNQVFFKKITHICITHHHVHHVGDVLTIIKQFPDAILVGDSGLLDGLQQQGANNVYRLLLGDTYSFCFGTIKAVKAFHNSCDGIALGFVISLGNKIIYHAGDTDYFEEMEEFADYKINVAFLPIGDTYTMGVDDAVKSAGLIKSKIVVPIHYNTFATIKADDMHFAQQIMLKQYGVPKVLRAGQYVVL